MKRFAIALLAGLALAAPVLADDLPINGIYNSTDLGGQALPGRGTNSRPVPDTGVDNVFNTQSWDGAALGTQWVFRCGVSYSQQRVDNRNASGTGTVVFTTLYDGGTFWLAGSGPWGLGTNDFTGTIGETTRITTLQYVNWVPVGARENINSSGLFDSGCLLTFAITNGTGAGDTDSMPFNAGYPARLDTDCATPRTSASWGDLTQITFMIDCTVPAEPSTWGGVKGLYR
jgi:hypothetical protein